MITYKPDISQLFNTAFGFKPLGYKIEEKETESDGINYSGIQTEAESTNNKGLLYPSIQTTDFQDARKLSWMGTPIMFPVVFKGGTYQFYNSSAELINFRLKDFDLPATTVVDFRRAKNITKTRVLGNNGTVKEIYGFDDWQIRIRGLCLDTPRISAYDQQSEMLLWEKIVDSIEVQGELFLDKDIYRLTIEEIDFRQPQGKHNVIPFEISASSDEPLELVL